jgi:hypothetical protein
MVMRRRSRGSIAQSALLITLLSSTSNVYNSENASHWSEERKNVVKEMRHTRVHRLNDLYFAVFLTKKKQAKMYKFLNQNTARSLHNPMILCYKRMNSTHRDKARRKHERFPKVTNREKNEEKTAHHDQTFSSALCRTGLSRSTDPRGEILWKSKIIQLTISENIAAINQSEEQSIRSVCHNSCSNMWKASPLGTTIERAIEECNGTQNGAITWQSRRERAARE